jgi:hypothetical protein
LTPECIKDFVQKIDFIQNIALMSMKKFCECFFLFAREREAQNIDFSQKFLKHEMEKTAFPQNT